MSKQTNVSAGYSSDRKPLASYAGLMAVFNATLAGSLWIANKRRALHPTPAGELVLLGIATQKLSRLLTKDKVTSPLRAPFTRYQDSAGQGELEERPRGHGIRLALGELLACPYCISQWIAGALLVGDQIAPTPTRLITRLFATLSLADFAQLAHTALKEHATDT